MKVCHTCRYYIDGGCQVNGDFRASSGKCRKWSGRSEKRQKPRFTPNSEIEKRRRREEEAGKTKVSIIKPNDDSHAPRTAHRCGICKFYNKGICQNENSTIFKHEVKSVDWCRFFIHWKD